MTEDSAAEAGYSQVASDQLDGIEASDPSLYEDLLDTCEDILDRPQAYRESAAAINTTEGIRMRTSVPGRHPFKVFWRTDGPRIEAVFPYSG